MHYYKFNIADWTLHTAHLTAEEEGIYLRLLNFYYDTESPIPKETQSVMRRLRLVSSSEKTTQVLEEFFTLEGDFWVHKRCEREIESYQGKIAANRANGGKGGGRGVRVNREKPSRLISITQT